MKTSKLHKALHSSDRHDWKTPTWLIDVVHYVYGGIDLDPMTGPDNNTRAKRWITPADDPGRDAWNARKGEQTLWLNPPYGRGIGEHVDRWIEAKGWLSRLLLVPARTDAKWFHRAYDASSHVLLLAGRLHFDDAGPAPFPSALFIHDHRNAPIIALSFAIAGCPKSGRRPIDLEGGCDCPMWLP